MPLLTSPRTLLFFSANLNDDVLAAFSTTSICLFSFNTSTADMRISPYLTLVGQTVSQARHPRHRSMPSCMSSIDIFSSAASLTRLILPRGECFSFLKAIYVGQTCRQ